MSIMKRIIAVLPVAAVVMCLSGCGLLFNGRKQDITVDSEPQGASVLVVGSNDRAVTPAKINLRRDEDYQIEFRKEGWQPTRTYVNSRADALPIVLDALLFWPSLIVDWPLGAIYDLEPEHVFVTLNREDKPAAVPPAAPPATPPAAVPPAVPPAAPPATPPANKQ